MSWSSHHARLKRMSAVFCQSLTLPHELRSRYGLRKKVSRTTRCNGCVARTLLKICVFLRMFLHPALHRSRKISMFSTMKKRHFSGTLVVARVPIGCWREDAPAGASGHTSRRKSKKGGHQEREAPPISRGHCYEGSSFRRTLISICSRHQSSPVTALRAYASRQPG